MHTRGGRWRWWEITCEGDPRELGHREEPIGQRGELVVGEPDQLELGALSLVGWAGLIRMQSEWVGSARARRRKPSQLHAQLHV